MVIYIYKVKQKMKERTGKKEKSSDVESFEEKETSCDAQTGATSRKMVDFIQ